MAFGRTGPHGPRKPDPVKAAIMESVLAGVPIPSAERKRELDVIEVEVSETTPTERLIRVKTNNLGTRYFKVKLSEMI